MQNISESDRLTPLYRNKALFDFSWPASISISLKQDKVVSVKGKPYESNINKRKLGNLMHVNSLKQALTYNEVNKENNKKFMEVIRLWKQT